MAGVSEHDRQVMKRQAAALADCETGEPGTESQRQDAIAAANADRREMDLAELKSEVEFHRKAVALGLIRR